MKVRHKQNQNEVFEVKEESSAYYIVHWHMDSSLCPAPFAKALPKSDYEPIPEARWVDVTATFNDGNHDGWHGISNGESNIVITGRHADYRLRKVRLCKPVPFYKPVDAFIIERQE